MEIHDSQAANSTARRSSAADVLAHAGYAPVCGYREAFENWDAACLWFDAGSGQIVDANAAAFALLASEPAEIVGTPLLRLAPTAEITGVGHVWQAIARGEAISERPLGVIDKAGNTVRVGASTFARDTSDRGQTCDLLVLQREDRPRSPAAHALAYEIAAAETRERQKIANGLHDEIGQVLAIIGLKLGGLGATAEPAQFASQVKELLAFIAQASQATRSATFELSCPLLQHLGLQAALEGLAQRLGSVSGIAIRVEGNLPEGPLAEPVAQVLFRVVRELLMNILKHAGARNAWVRIENDAREMRFIVSDDGDGMPRQARRQFGPGGGYGLLNVEAQIQAIGGRFSIGSGSPCGTRAEIVLPVLTNPLPNPLPTPLPIPPS